MHTHTHTCRIFMCVCVCVCVWVAASLKTQWPTGAAFEGILIGLTSDPQPEGGRSRPSGPFSGLDPQARRSKGRRHWGSVGGSKTVRSTWIVKPRYVFYVRLQFLRLSSSLERREKRDREGGKERREKKRENNGHWHRPPKARDQMSEGPPAKPSDSNQKGPVQGRVQLNRIAIRLCRCGWVWQS